MRLLSLAALLLCGTAAAACSFQPSGPNAGDDDPTDAAVEVDACIPAAETCEGTDQDCDGMIDEGLTAGAPCDGPDADQCLDDMTVCDANGAVVCGNTSGDDDAELCNAMDDDCDGMTDEGFMVAAACDGPDGDQCNEGVFACAQDGASAVCTDDTTTIVESCNGMDDDCDGTPDNGFDIMGDVQNCGECGNTCTNDFGNTTCSMGNCLPTCSNGAAQCDGDPDNGCELQDTNPSCNQLAATALTVTGDAAQSVMSTGTSETFLKVRIRESISNGGGDLTAQIALASGAGTNFDLHVYCFACGALPLSDAADDTIEIGRDDDVGDRSFDVWVEVRYNASVPSTTCASWTLTVTGNVITNNRCAGVGGGG